VQAEAALGVTGSIEDGCGEAASVALRGGSDSDEAAIGGTVVGGGDIGGGDTEPTCLRVHDPDEREVELVVEDGRAGEGFEALCPGDVVDVRVGDDDLLDGEVMLLQDGDDAGDLFAGIDDDGFAGGLVSEDGAVALQEADDKDFVDQAGPPQGAELVVPGEVKQDAQAWARAWCVWSRKKGLLLGGGLRGGGLRGRMPGAREHGVIAAVTGEQDGEADRGQHEEDGGPGGELGKEISGAARAKGRLGALSAEGACEVSRLALLDEDDADKEEADDDMDCDDEGDHGVAFETSGDSELPVFGTLD